MPIALPERRRRINFIDTKEERLGPFPVSAKGVQSNAEDSTYTDERFKRWGFKFFIFVNTRPFLFCDFLAFPLTVF